MDGEASLDERALRGATKTAGIKNNIDERTIRQLILLEDAIKKELSSREDARRELGRHNLSVVSLAEASGVSRSTIYGKKILSEYVRIRVDALDLDPLARENETLREQLADARRRISAMELRDGELVLAKMEIERLKRQLESARKAGMKRRK